MSTAGLHKVNVTITDVTHHTTSSMGNPTYRIHTDDGLSYLTETNGQVGYKADNYRPRRSGETVAAVLTLTQSGRVRDISAAEDATEG